MWAALFLPPVHSLPYTQNIPVGSLLYDPAGLDGGPFRLDLGPFGPMLRTVCTAKKGPSQGGTELSYFVLTGPSTGPLVRGCFINEEAKTVRIYETSVKA